MHIWIWSSRRAFRCFYARLAISFLFPLKITACRPRFGGQTPKKNPPRFSNLPIQHLLSCGTLFRIHKMWFISDSQASSSLLPKKNSHQDSECLNRQWHRCQGFFSPDFAGASLCQVPGNSEARCSVRWKLSVPWKFNVIIYDDMIWRRQDWKCRKYCNRRYTNVIYIIYIYIFSVYIIYTHIMYICLIAVSGDCKFTVCLGYKPQQYQGSNSLRARLWD